MRPTCGSRGAGSTSTAPEVLVEAFEPLRGRQRGCDAKAARRFLAKALRTRQHWPPHVINTDQNPAYGEALRQLKRDDPDVESIEHRQAKYLNNRIEADHGPIKRLCRATLGFKSMKTAYATIKGFEVMRMFKKGQFAPWIDAICGETEARFIASSTACSVFMREPPSRAGLSRGATGFLQ
jgi:hypothetical protein